MNYALELKDVSKTYPRSEFTLDKITFSVPSGSIMGVVGENGAGKSTTIGCILNTLFKDSGRIKLFGREMRDEDVDIRERIGVVYDGDNFPGYFSAEQLGDIMSGIYRRWDPGLFDKYLGDFGLDRKQKIRSYSKGMTMKLAIAAALSHHPDLLILDEATGGLDPVVRDEMLDVFLDFVGTEDHSILLSSHITSDLEKIADHITFIHKGKVIMTEAKDELIYHYGIMRCSDKQFAAVDRADRIAWRKRDYQTDVLVSDREKAVKKYQNVSIDHATVDEIMLLLIKGEKE